MSNQQLEITFDNTVEIEIAQRCWSMLKSANVSCKEAISKLRKFDQRRLVFEDDKGSYGKVKIYLVYSNCIKGRNKYKFYYVKIKNYIETGVYSEDFFFSDMDEKT